MINYFVRIEIICTKKSFRWRHWQPAGCVHKTECKKLYEELANDEFNQEANLIFRNKWGDQVKFPPLVASSLFTMRYMVEYKHVKGEFTRTSVLEQVDYKIGDLKNCVWLFDL